MPVQTQGEVDLQLQPICNMAVLGGGWSVICCSCFTEGKDPVRIVQEAGWALGLVWTAWKISPSQVFSPLPSSPRCSIVTCQFTNFLEQHIAFIFRVGE